MPTFDSQVKFQKIPVLDFVAPQAATASAPASPIVGQLWFDTTVNQLKVCTNATGPVWTQCDNVTGGTASNVADGDKGEITVTSGVWTIDTGVVTYPKIQNVTGSRLLGNDTGSPVAPREIILASDHEFSGGTLRNTVWSGGDIAKAAGAATATINNGAVTYAKMANVGAYRLIGNYTGASAAPMDVPLTVDMNISAGSLSVEAYSGGDIVKARGATSATIGATKVTTTHINAALIASGDTVGGTAGSATVGQGALRSLGMGSGNVAMPGNTSLNAIATATPPTAAIAVNGQKITGLADGTAASDAATKGQLDSVSAGLDPKGSVKAVQTVSVFSGGIPSGGVTVDGIALVNGDRVLLTGQAAPGSAANNGIWVVGTPWTRPADMDNWSEVPGAFTFVEQGTTYADTGWVCTADQGGTIGSTAMTWTQFSGAGSFVDGAGLLKTGNTLDVVTDNSTLEIVADQVRIKDAGVTAVKLASNSVNLAASAVTGTLPIANGGTGGTTAVAARANIGAGGIATGTTPALTAGTWATITHNLQSRARNVTFEEVSTLEGRVLDWRVNSTNPNTQVDIRCDVAGGRAINYYNYAVVA